MSLLNDAPRRVVYVSFSFSYRLCLQVAPSFLVFFHRCVRPYEPFIDTTLHVLDDAFLMVSSVLAWLFRPFARAWSWIKPVFVSKPPPTPVPKERRKMRYSMRADFPGALPKTPGPPHLSGSQNGLAPPSSVGKQDLMAAFEARHSGTPAGSLAAKAQALADAQLRADAAAIKTTTTKGSSRQPIKQKKKDANAGPAAPSARVLGKRKGPTAVTTTSIKSVASELSENAGEDDVDVDVEEKNKDAEEYGDKKPRLSGTHGIPDAERRPAIVGSFDMDDISLPKPRRSPPRRGSATAEARRVVSAGPLPKPSRQRTSAPAASQATSTTATATAPASRVPVTKRKASDTALVRERDRLHARSGGNGKKVSALDEDGSRANGAEEEAAAAERSAASNVTMKRPRHRVASK